MIISALHINMTPRLSNLYDMEEGLVLGVQVVDGHTIKGTSVGKIKIRLLDDNGNILHADFHGCIYVPGLNH
jgi:hypothetical protein